MRKFIALAAAASLAALSTVAVADEAPAAAPVAAHEGQMVYSSDGKRLGRIDRVTSDRAGIIADMKYIYVPLASLSAGEKGRLVTSLTAVQARK